MTRLAAEVASLSDDLIVEPGRRRARSQFRLRRTLALLTMLTIAPALVLVTRLIAFRPRIAPDSDLAVTEMRLRDVGRHPVLLGPYSRFAWHHLGPALFYVLAVPYRFLGGTSASMYASATLLNAVMLVGCVLIAYRRGGNALAVWTLAVLGVYLAALSPAVLSSPWNPLVALLPFVLFVLVAWSIAVGDIVLLPLGVGLGSFLVQTHIGYAAAVGLAVPFAAIGARTRAAFADGAWRAPVVISLLVAGILWLPPIVQEIEPGGGNLTDVASFFLHSRPDHSVTETTPLVLGQLGAVPARAVGAVGPVSGRGEGGLVDSPWLFGLVTVALAGAAAFGAARRRGTDARARDALWLFGLGGALAVAGVAVLARVEGPLYGFITIWTSAISVVLWIALGTMWMPTTTRTAGQRAAYLIAFVTIGTVAIGNSAAAITTNAPATTLASTDVYAFSDAVMPHVPRTSGTQVWAVAVNYETWQIMTGVVNQLERRGVRVKVRGWEYMLGERRTADTQPPGSIALVFSNVDLARRMRRHTDTAELSNNGAVWMFLDSNGL